jgi:hypothetical protein
MVIIFGDGLVEILGEASQKKWETCVFWGFQDSSKVGKLANKNSWLVVFRA